MPSTFRSTRADRAKDSSLQQQSTQRPEDYMDAEDLAALQKRPAAPPPKAEHDGKREKLAWAVTVEDVSYGPARPAVEPKRDPRIEQVAPNLAPEEKKNVKKTIAPRSALSFDPDEEDRQQQSQGSAKITKMARLTIDGKVAAMALQGFLPFSANEAKQNRYRLFLMMHTGRGSKDDFEASLPKV